MSVFKEMKGLAYVTPRKLRLSPSAWEEGAACIRQAPPCTRAQTPPPPPTRKHARRSERPCLICDIATGICHSRSYS